LDKLQSMKVFVQIAQGGSLAAAARQTGMSPPTIARHLADLEAHLKVRLCNRTTRRLSLTAEGTDYLAVCLGVLQDLDEAEARLAQQHRQVSGTLTIAAPVLLGQMLVGPITRAFVLAHPEVRCRLIFSDGFTDLVEQGVDVAVRIDNLTDSGMVVQRLGRVRRVVVATPSYLEANGAPSNPEDLILHNCIGTGRPWLFRVKGREVQVPVQGNLLFNMGPPALDACLSGIGLGMFLSYQVGVALRNGQLIQVLSRFSRRPMDVNAVVPQSRMLAQRTKSYLAWLQQHMRPTLLELGATDPP
jgi:DNA-binding transcriptional LysR family regulator